MIHYSKKNPEDSIISYKMREKSAIKKASRIFGVPKGTIQDGLLEKNS